MGRYRYVLALDIRHYFLSIGHQVLLSIMARAIKRGRLMALLGRIIESGEGLYTAPEIATVLKLPAGFPPPACGLPIGNLTSQWWGNQYLSGFDHFLKRELRVPHVQRYMDDITLMADDLGFLCEAANVPPNGWPASASYVSKSRRSSPVAAARYSRTSAIECRGRASSPGSKSTAG